MFCPQCGARVDENVAVCTSCGARLDRSQAQTETQAGNYSSRLGAHSASSVEGQGVLQRAKHAASAVSAAAKQPATPAHGGPANDRARQDAHRRHKFMGAVLGVAVALVVVFLIWDTNFRPYSVNAKDFPSDGLRAAALQLDADGDGLITRAQAREVNQLSVEGGTSVSGLDVFPNLETLNIDCDTVESIDLSKASNLRALDASGDTALDSLQLAGAGALQALDVSETQLESLDVSSEAALSSIDVSSSAVSSLNVSGLAQLSSLDADGCAVSSLDVSGLSNLSALRCANGVEVQGLSDTPLQECWVATGFTNSIPEYGGASGQEASLQAIYDDTNRLSQVTYSASKGAVPATIDYAYDDAGRLVQVSFNDMPSSSAAPGNNVWTLSYNDSGQLVKAANETGAVFAYTYDSEGNLATCEAQTSPTAQASLYEFSYSEGGLASIVCDERETALEYDTQGRLSKVTATEPEDEAASKSDSDDDDAAGADGDTSTSASKSDESDSANDESPSSDNSQARTVVALYSFVYDKDSRCIGYLFESSEAPEGVLSEKFSYNAEGQLVSASRESDGESNLWYYSHHGIDDASFEYDEQGNLVSGTLTRSDQSEGATEEYQVSYTRLFATSDTMPRGSIFNQAYPLNDAVDANTYLASAVASGASVFTPWANEPELWLRAFDADAAVLSCW